MDILERADQAAGWFVAGVFTVSTAASTYDSYTGLRTWALEHGDAAVKADLFPLFIDAFALGAEAFMFRAALRGWGWGAKLVGWVVAGAGLALSIALNVGQYHSTDWLTQGTQGIAPLAAFFSLLVGSIMFEQSMKESKKQDAAEQPAETVVTVQDDTESVDSKDAVDEAEEPQAVAVSDDLAELFQRAELTFAADIRRGHKTGLGRIKKELGGGQRKIRDIQHHLDTVIKTQNLAV